MVDVLKLCDSAQDHFEQNGDPASRAYMDAFSIELVHVIGNYLAERMAR
jgi:hypothetical protein